MSATLTYEIFAVVSSEDETSYGPATETRGEKLGEITVPAHMDTFQPVPCLKVTGLMGDHLRKAGFDLPAFTMDRYLKAAGDNGLAIRADGGFMRAPMVLWCQVKA